MFINSFPQFIIHYTTFNFNSQAFCEIKFLHQIQTTLSATSTNLSFRQVSKSKYCKKFWNCRFGNSIDIKILPIKAPTISHNHFHTTFLHFHFQHYFKIQFIKLIPSNLSKIINKSIYPIPYLNRLSIISALFPN